MTAEQLRDIIAQLRGRVDLDPSAESDEPVIVFDVPTEAELVAAGLYPAGVKRLLAMPWWEEMVEDIIDTPDMCDSGDTPETVLQYARDVVNEYIYKRFPLEEKE